jgi:RNA polymerase sigma-70 factor (ECF subfamily)
MFVIMDRKRIQELVNSSQKNDPKAFGLLVVEFQALVFRFAFRLLCDEDEAKDIVQDTFVKAWINLRKYNPEYQFSTWIYKITSNLCYDRLRKMKNYPLNTDFPETASEQNPESDLINNELKELIIYFTNGLTPKQKLVFTLNDIEDLETSEIKAITGLSEAKIKSNLYLARKFIKNKITSVTK